MFHVTIQSPIIYLHLIQQLYSVLRCLLPLLCLHLNLIAVLCIALAVTEHPISEEVKGQVATGIFQSTRLNSNCQRQSSYVSSTAVQISSDLSSIWSKFGPQGIEYEWPYFDVYGIVFVVQLDGQDSDALQVFLPHRHCESNPIDLQLYWLYKAEPVVNHVKFWPKLVQVKKKSKIINQVTFIPSPPIKPTSKFKPQTNKTQGPSF